MKPTRPTLAPAGAPISLLLGALALCAALLSGCVLLADTDVSDETLGAVAGSFETCGRNVGSCAPGAFCVAPGRENPTVGFCAPACDAGSCGGAGAACVLQLPGSTEPGACALTCDGDGECPDGLACLAFDGVSLCVP